MTVYAFGYNFRSDSGYVTDPANTKFQGGHAYPTSYTFTGFTPNAGWDADLTAESRSRSDAFDPRHAGVVRLVSGTLVFRTNLPVSGAWDIRMAVGDALFEFDSNFDIIDSDGSTVLYSHGHTLTTAEQFCDASGVVRTSSADWVSNNAVRTITFSGTEAYIRCNPATVGALSMSGLAHVSFYKDTASSPTVSTVSSASNTEGSAVVHTVTLSAATTASTNFAASLTGVTATGGGTDFTSNLASATYSNGVTYSGGNFVVPSGVSSFTVTITTTADTLDEANETWTLTVGGVSGTGTITDDDPLPSISINDVSQSGSTYTFTITLSAASGRSVTVDYATANGAKTAGTDYTAVSGTVTFAPGETSKTVSVTVL